MASSKRIRHADQAYNLSRRIEDRIKSQASTWVIYKLPLMSLTQAWMDTFKTLGYSRLPLFYQGKLDGIRQTLREHIIREHAEWRVSWRGQEYHSSSKDSRDNYDHAAVGSKALPDSLILTGTWCEVDSDQSRHVWRGTDKDFYGPKMPDPAPVNVASAGANTSTSEV
jgi:hypothetical protein